MKLIIDIVGDESEEGSPVVEIAPPPNGTIEHVRATLLGIVTGQAQPPCWFDYYGAVDGGRLQSSLSRVVGLLEQLERAGVGSGREVTVRFKA